MLSMIVLLGYVAVDHQNFYHLGDIAKIARFMVVKVVVLIILMYV